MRYVYRHGGYEMKHKRTLRDDSIENALSVLKEANETERLTDYLCNNATDADLVSLFSEVTECLLQNMPSREQAAVFNAFASSPDFDPAWFAQNAYAFFEEFVNELDSEVMKDQLVEREEWPQDAATADQTLAASIETLMQWHGDTAVMHAAQKWRRANLVNWQELRVVDGNIIL
jgi:hypothetical protein